MVLSWTDTAGLIPNSCHVGLEPLWGTCHRNLETYSLSCNSEHVSLTHFLFLCQVLILTQSVSHSSRPSFFRRLSNSSRVAATDTEAVGFALSKVEQGKAGGLHWHPGVHPLPCICTHQALRTDLLVSNILNLYKGQSNTLYCLHSASPSPHNTWHPHVLSGWVASSSVPRNS